MIFGGDTGAAGKEATDDCCIGADVGSVEADDDEALLRTMLLLKTTTLEPLMTVRSVFLFTVSSSVTLLLCLFVSLKFTKFALSIGVVSSMMTAHLADVNSLFDLIRGAAVLLHVGVGATTATLLKRVTDGTNNCGN